MELPKNIFREYDIRGDAETELGSAAVETIARSFGTWLRERGVNAVPLGGDVRLSTARIREAAASGLMSAGVNVTDVGTLTTPMLYWSLIRLGMEGGVMITGSHNPPNMNGLKLCFGRGTLWGDQIQEIRRIAESGKFASGEGKMTAVSIADDYLAMLKSKFADVDFSRFRVVCDSGNGAAGPLAGRFFRSLGCGCTEMFAEPDGRFPNHHPDPQKRENMIALSGRVKAEGADAGFAFDGDADRIGVVDEHGELIFGDRLMALYWREVLEAHPGAVGLVEPKCSMALPEEIARLGGEVRFCRSGHSVIKADMRELGAPFAGELSGHMFFADEYYGFDDSFYAAGRLLRILARTGKKLSELMASIPLYPATEEVRVPCPDDVKFALVGRIRDDAVRDRECMTQDGVRMIYPDGWGLIRASNTQPVITIRCEGRDEAALRAITDDVKRRCAAEGLPDFEWTR